MKTTLTLGVLAVIVLGWQQSTIAMGRRVVACDIAQRGMIVLVGNGIGVDIRLACAGNIADAQVSDPSRIIVRKRGPQQIYIKPIAPVNFPGNLHSSDGTTMLSVVTTTGDVYQFGIKTTSSSPYSFLDIGGRPAFSSTLANRPHPLPHRFVASRPTASTSPSFVASNPLPVEYTPQPPQQNDSAPLPLLTKLPEVVQSKPTPTALPSSPSTDALPVPTALLKNDEPDKPLLPQSVKPAPQILKSFTTHSQANAIVRGLSQMRRSNKRIYRSPFWLKMQDVVYRLRQGQTLAKASTKSGVSLAQVEAVLRLGLS